ncbi:MAG: ABC transporter substrate-binding protein, partial [Rhodospirillaceae bacterium]|nr:ABC transporter substrate-binding protein [Rhodospirillaceae bacterium]
RNFIAGAAATGGLAAASTFIPTRFAIGAQAPIKVGIMLPFSGTYAKLGENITDAMMMRIAQAGGMLGGRNVDYIKLDSEAAPPKAVDNATKLVKGRKVDFVVGPVHSGVGMAMTKVMKKAPKTIMVVPNAGANQLTREACAPNIFRTSFSNWQTSYPMGTELHKRGHKKIVTLTWNYAAGKQMADAVAQGYSDAGGDASGIEKLWVDFPSVSFQPLLTKIAAIKPDAVWVFFSGGGAVKFVKDYAASIDKAQIPLYGTFVTEGTLQAQGAAAEGIVTTMHWADTLDNPVNHKFMADFKTASGRNADVFAVQGYDTGSLLLLAMAAVGGDTTATPEIIKAMENTIVEGPRGPWRMSPTHNPIQNIYLRRVENGRNVILGVAHEALEDPGTGCKL